MKNNKATYMKNSILPCAVFSALTGCFTGIVIFLFKLCTAGVMKISEKAYTFVGENPIWLPLLILGAAAIGLLSALILKLEKMHLRKLIKLEGLKKLLTVFLSSLLTFLGSVPLGTEGPGVQIGSIIGEEAVNIFGKKHTPLKQDIKTGGAGAGFASATGAPLSGIIYALEAAKCSFSPLPVITAAVTVSISTATMHLLCSLTHTSPYLFDFLYEQKLPLRYLWIAALIGVICGIIAIAFTDIYSKVGIFLNTALKKIPFAAKAVAIFALVGVLGFLSSSFIGSGHELIIELTEGKGIWYMLLLCFCIRALTLMLAKQTGISGGTFVPTLTFGALIGAVLSQVLMQIGVLPEKYFIIPIIIGIVSFLGAYLKAPVMAIVFAVEALGGLSNSLPIAIGVTFAFLIAEIPNAPSLQGAETDNTPSINQAHPKAAEN